MIKSTFSFISIVLLILFSSCTEDDHSLEPMESEVSQEKSDDDPYNSQIIRYNIPGVQKFGYQTLVFVEPVGWFLYIGNYLGGGNQGSAFKVAVVQRNSSNPLLPLNVTRIDPIKLYFLLSPDFTDLLLTTDRREKDRLINKNWIDKSGGNIVLPGNIRYLVDAFISKTQVSGTVPLYRLRHIPTGRHFYTADETEKDNIMETSEYELEGEVGYVKI